MWPNTVNKLIITLIFLIAKLNNCELVKSSETANIYCHKDFISTEIFSNNTNDRLRAVYWTNSNIHSMSGCQLSHHKNGISLKIFLKDFYKCGFVRYINKWKNHTIYYQDLILEQKNGEVLKIPIKCAYKIMKVSTKFKHKLTKRDILPADFKEVEDVEILDTLEQQATEPQVLIQVRQNDQLIDGMVTVIPGTPLVMEVKLNEEASQIYGLKVNYLEVSDTRDTSETILFRGCTVDPYLFENFNLTNSNSLKSKFRAFKFPNTAYVQFKANVEICLKKCLAPQCIGSSTNLMRKRRDTKNYLKNQYEVTLALIMKITEIDDIKNDKLLELEKHVKDLKMKMLILNNKLQ